MQQNVHRCDIFVCVDTEKLGITFPPIIRCWFARRCLYCLRRVSVLGGGGVVQLSLSQSREFLAKIYFRSDDVDFLLVVYVGVDKSVISAI